MSKSRSGPGKREVRVERPDRWVVLDAQITEAIDARIEDRPQGRGIWLTIVDMDTESGEETQHATIEEAKRQASAVTGVDSIRWRRK